MKTDLRAYRTFQALILGGLAIFLLAKIGDGRILLYINQRFVFLSLFAALTLLVLAQVVLRARPGLKQGESGPEPAAAEEHDHEHASSRSGVVLWLLALPILIGFLAPQRPLGASAASLRGVSSTSSLLANGADSGRSLAVPQEQRSVLDWMRAFAAEPEAMTGQSVDVTGFVYRDPREDGNHFYVARFSVTCCVADASAVGLEVSWPDGAVPPDNSWVRVQGSLAARTTNGQAVPYIQARKVETVPAPEQPYLFQ